MHKPVRNVRLLLSTSVLRYLWVKLSFITALDPPKAQAVSYQYALGSEPLQEYPGGFYRAASSATFPVASALSGGLNILKPGGMRELHWHAVDEWAIVINGTCRGLVLKYGSEHPTNSWDWHTGDIWYFPANFGHALIGLQEGCTYVAGYNNGAFDDARDSFGLSNWLATAPPAIVAQNLGIHPDAVTANIRSSLNTFMPQGNLQALLEGESVEPPVLVATNSPKQPVTVTPDDYRLPLLSGYKPEVKTDGGVIHVASAANFPVSANMTGAFVRLYPGAMRGLHWHPNENEWQYIINGTLGFGVFNGTGHVSEGTGGPGDIGYAPKGSGHYFVNTGDTDAFLVLVWDKGMFTNIDLTSFMGVFSPAWVATSLEASVDFVDSLDTSLSGIMAQPSWTPLSASQNAA